MSLGEILFIPGIGGTATPPAFAPTDIASLLWWYDISDTSTLFQDSAGTIAVTADGDPVGRVLDKSGNGHHRIQTTSGSRPTYRTSAGLHWLEYDGINDSMYTASLVDCSAIDTFSLCVGASKVTGNNNAVVVENSANGLTNDGTIRISANGGSLENWEFGLRGTVAQGQVRIPLSGNSTNVLTVIAELLSGAVSFGDQVIVEIDGTPQSVGGAPTTGGGNFGNYIFHFGRRNNASNPWDGNEYQSTAFTSLISGTDLSNIESFVAGKTGVTL